MLAVVLFYGGLIVALLGGVSLIKPPAWIGISTRRRAGCFLGGGLLLAGLAWTLPAREVEIAAPRTRLDQFAPRYQFHEVHSIRVLAPKDRVYRAIQQVTAGEILFFQTLIWIRRFGRPGPESLLNAPERMPLLAVATQTTFLSLAEEPPREIVVGTLVMVPAGRRSRKPLTPQEFKTIREAGFALATMNFLVEDAGPGASTVTTETRVYATDSSARRRFARYWRVIYPGSALIRRMWLRALKRRAEGGAC